MIEAGQRLGPYEIVSPIGAGGMGEVWKALDTRLDRHVAVKVLPAALAASAKLNARFDREAKAISALSHPHICTLHDVGHENGTSFLVMEYLEGESLADRLRRGPLPMGEVLRYGQQIAQALEAAHRRGIVHRDLKPGNIMLTRSGAKLLDFGLARTASAPVSDAEGFEALTENKPLTTEGTIVGTFQYMAPEQLEGLEADARTDIFALGVVLYEMATGRRAFRGESRTSLIAAIVASEPKPMAELVPQAPPALEHVVRKCLEKNRDERWQSAHDVGAELEWISETGLAADAQGGTDGARRWKRRALFAGLPMAFLAGLVAASMFLRTRPPEHFANPRVVRSEIALEPGLSLAGWGTPIIAISPDGRTIAYVGHDGAIQRLYIRRLDAESATLVPDSESAEGPFFSPDGKFVGFAVGVSGLPGPQKAELRRVAVDGGLPQTISPLNDFFGAIWAPDDTIYFVDQSSEGVWKVAASGGQKRPLGATGTYTFLTSMLEDGTALLASIATTRHPNRLALIDTTSGELTDLGLDGIGAFAAPGGRLVYFNLDRRVVVTHFAAGGRSVTGPGVPLLDDLAIAAFDFPMAALSAEGTLIFTRGFVNWSHRELGRLVRVGADGSVTPLPFEADTYSRRGISISPDGSRLAMNTWPDQLWIGDLRRGTRVRHPQADRWLRATPLWSPDGRRLAFTLYANDALHMGVAETDGSGKETILTTDFKRPFEAHAGSWMDATTLLYLHRSAEEDATLLKTMNVENPQSSKTLMTVKDAFINHARVSPDGRWIAYRMMERERDVLYVRRADGTGHPVMVAPGAFVPKWRPRSNELLFSVGDKLMSSVVGGVDDPDPAPPREVAELKGLKAFDALPGTREIVALLSDPEANRQTKIVMVQNWLSEVDGKVPPLKTTPGE